MLIIIYLMILAEGSRAAIGAYLHTSHIMMIESRLPAGSDFVHKKSRHISLLIFKSVRIYLKKAIKYITGSR